MNFMLRSTIWSLLMFLSIGATAQNGFFKDHKVIKSVSNCAKDSATVCLSGIAPSKAAAYKFTLNGKAFAGPYKTCEIDTTVNYSYVDLVSTGPYTIDSVRLNGKLFLNKKVASIPILVDSLKKWDPTANWTFDASKKTLIGLKPGKGKYGLMRIVPDAVVSTVSSLGANIQYAANGSLIRLAVGKYVLKGTEPSSAKVDSMLITIACTSSETVKKTINAGQNSKYCVSTTQLTGRVKSLTNLCPVANDPVTYTIASGDSCISYVGNKIGTSKACLYACDVNNICDTTYLNVEVQKKASPFGSHLVNGVVNQGQKTKYCIDTLGFGKITSVTNTLPLASGKNVKFTINGANTCIDIEGLTFGVDTANIIIKTTSGKADTTLLYYTTVKACNVIPSDTLFAQSNKCGLKGEFCIPKFSLTEALKYTFTIDGILYTGTKKGCDFDTVRSYSYTTLFGGGAVGPYEVTSWNVNGKTYGFTFNTLQALVDSMNSVDKKGAWKLLTASKQIVGGFPGNTYSNINVIQTTFSSPSVLGFNIGLKAQGTKISFETGARRIVVTNPTTGCIDTVYAYFQCITPDIITDNIKVGQKDTTCIKFDQLFANKAVSVINILPNTAGSAVNFTLSADKKCVYYTGLSVGTDTAIIIACDSKKICDTTYIYVNVGTGVVPVGPKIYRDTIAISTGSELCIDLAFANGEPIKSFQNLCQNKSGTNVVFKLNPTTYCVEYNATKVIGTDTACIVTCTQTKCDTTLMYITVKGGVIPTNPGVLFDTVQVSSTKKICIKATDLKNKVGTNLTITNLFTNKVKNADITADLDKSCIANGGIGVSVSSTGLKPGKDTACVEIKDNDTGKSDTVKVYITVVPKLTIKPIYDTVFVTETKFICIDLKKLNVAKIDTIINLCPKSSGTNVTPTLSKNLPACKGPGIIFKGLTVGTDTLCLVFIDNDGKADTANVYLTAISKQRKPNVYTETVGETITGFRCFDAKDFDLGADIDSIYNACPKLSGTNASIKIQTKGTTTPCKSGFGISFTGIKAGVDTACIVLIDKNGDKDTATVYVNVVPVKPQAPIVKDTIFQYQTKTYCVDTAVLKLNGKITKVENLCPKLSGTQVTFTIDTLKACTTINGGPGLSITYNGLQIGTDTACIKVTDSFGKSDSLTVIVTVKKLIPLVIDENLLVSATKTVCIDTSRIAGPVTSIVNKCPNLSGKNAKFDINPITKCIKITGLTPGVDTACIVICNAKGVCDSTTIFATIIDKGKIKANDDKDTTTLNAAKTIDVLKNDVLGDTVKQKITVKLLPKANGGKGPNHGSAIVDTKSNKIMYVPEFGFTGRDTFTYIVCVGTVCDTADVIIYIAPQAKDFHIYNGFSPNGDNKNDTFVIDGIESFPGSELIIYNRWGNQVHRVTDYKNDWGGTWNNSDLPDGTYYYALCRFEGKDQPTKTFTGWLQIAR